MGKVLRKKFRDLQRENKELRKTIEKQRVTISSGLVMGDGSIPETEVTSELVLDGPPVGSNEILVDQGV